MHCPVLPLQVLTALLRHRERKQKEKNSAACTNYHLHVCVTGEMRELKFHEQKLLKKVNFLQWKSDQNVREIQVLRRYHVQNRDDYVKYSKVAGLITKLAAKMKLLKQDDPVRTNTTNLLIDKLFNMGLIPTKKSLLQCEALPVSAFCRRRLPVVLVRMKFCETLKEAVTFVEQGHIRVGVPPFASRSPSRLHPLASVHAIPRAPPLML